MDLIEFDGKRIRQVRESLGWSREFLAEKTGVPVRTIQDIEMGVSKNPGIETIKQIVLGFPTQEKNKESKAEIILNIQSLLNNLSQDDLETIQTTAENLLKLSQVKKSQKSS